MFECYCFCLKKSEHTKNTVSVVERYTHGTVRLRSRRDNVPVIVTGWACHARPTAMDDIVRSVRGSPDGVGGGYTRPETRASRLPPLFYHPVVPVRPQSSGCLARKRKCVLSCYYTN